ncbi:hypothetical protein GWR56_07420 [Mucilaginibacter sp. 14171R-50]|uniref:hypothetical protein n=1 Tax=Mucilaginibacter sp. 14171R-50 TaxID=2703789 RepID=UPI00138BE4A0|nr:hypothetical protein [Mucilaginibacter sp. 14171R-50]QHS55376.1 hypothetical protein GWR56_07420 [Mucilaginibacter sp. 14171R-50]
MKTILSTLLIAVLGIGYSNAQTVMSRKTVTTKVVPLKYKDQTDTLYLPQIADRLPQLQKALSEKELLTGETLQDVINEYTECGCGITSLQYEVTCLYSDLISIKLTYETMGAYPSTNQRWLTLNPNTGKAIPLSKIITPRGLQFIKAEYKKILLNRISKDRKAYAGDADYVAVLPKLMSSVNKLSLDSPQVKYLVTKEGILLSSETILPHVAESFEPDRNVLFGYNQLMKFKYLDAKGVLGKH